MHINNISCYIPYIAECSIYELKLSHLVLLLLQSTIIIKSIHIPLTNISALYFVIWRYYALCLIPLHIAHSVCFSFHHIPPEHFKENQRNFHSIISTALWWLKLCTYVKMKNNMQMANSCRNKQLNFLAKILKVMLRWKNICLVCCVYTLYSIKFYWSAQKQ